MNKENIKKILDVKKLCDIENYIINNGRGITEQDKEILKRLEDIMDNYTYGWYIYQENLIDQLKNINKFKIFILNLIQ